jgi:heat shock protein HtpX
MPLTFIDIERQKNWRIGLFFAVLLLVYLAVIAVLGAVFLPVPLNAAPRFGTFAVLTALVVAGIHFWFAASNAVNDVVRSLDAQPPDPDDSVHRVFANIMEELHVVMGNRRNVTCAVIPSLSLNALAAADLKGNALIAVTEGLLSRLTRPQLEAVAAHEMHHILSGDCLESTVAASLFGTLSSAIEKFRSSRGYVVMGVMLAWVLLQLGNLLNMLISREREYRADAGAVRMTRNPLALAEVLHLLSRSWRGAGFIGEGFQNLCIVNPRATALDEAEGFVADLLSTHPPLRKRIDIMLGMARVPVSELDRRAADRAATAASPPAPAYYAMSPRQQWEGPYTLAELAGLPWLSPLTWMAAGGGQNADRAWKDPVINRIFLDRLSQEERADAGTACPSCRQPLVAMHYEGTQLHRCTFCAGTLVETARIPRIIARTGRGQACSERITSLARAVVNENLRRSAVRRHGNGEATVPKLHCPRCTAPMYRGFYSQAHLIEVDRCSNCGLTWFDQDELEMLQCLIEHRLVPELVDDGAGMRDQGPAGN